MTTPSQLKPSAVTYEHNDRDEQREHVANPKVIEQNMDRPAINPETLLDDAQSSTISDSQQEQPSGRPSTKLAAAQPLPRIPLGTVPTIGTDSELMISLDVLPSRNIGPKRGTSHSSTRHLGARRSSSAESSDNNNFVPLDDRIPYISLNDVSVEGAPHDSNRARLFSPCSTSPTEISTFSFQRILQATRLPSDASSPDNSHMLPRHSFGRRRRLLKPNSRDEKASHFIPKEIAEQFRKGVSFTANIVGGAVGVSELRGVPNAPHTSQAALDLANVALRVKEGRELSPRQHKRRTMSFGANSAGVHLSPIIGARICGPIDRRSTQRRTSWQVTPEMLPRIAVDGLPQMKESIKLPPPTDLTPLVSMEDLHEIATPPSKGLSPAIPKPSTLDQLSFLTFNAGLLEYRLGGLAWYRNPPFTKRRLYQIAPALMNCNCDVVALQEVYEEWQADYLIDYLRVIFPFVARRTSGGQFSLHNGLMILSRFPILKTAFHPFHSVTAIEKMFASKGMLEATLEIPTVGQVTFVNIHLASGAVDPESTSLEALRNEEIKQVLDVCQLATSRYEIPVIIGDLNAAPNLCSSNYRRFCEEGWRDAYLAAVRGYRESDPNVELAALDSWFEDPNRLFSHSRSTNYATTTTGSSRKQKHRQLRGTPRGVIAIKSKRRRFLCRNHPSAKNTGTHPPLRLRQTRVASSFEQSAAAAAAIQLREHSDQADTASSLTKKECDNSANLTHTFPLEVQSSLPMDSMPKQDDETPGTPRFDDERCKLLRRDDHRNRMLERGSSRQRNGTTMSSSSPPVCARSKGSHGLDDCSLGSSSSSSENSEVDLALLPEKRGRRQSSAPGLKCQTSRCHHFKLHSTENPQQPPRRRQVQRLNRCMASSESMVDKMAKLVRHAGNVLGVETNSTFMDMNTDGDPFCTQAFTWDPRNPLNAIGPHAECHGIRCDHIFLPPATVARDLKNFRAAASEVVFSEPRVTVEGCCCGLLGQPSLVTLSDHYGIRVELQRMKPSA